jgi:hypothetical protein
VHSCDFIAFDKIRCNDGVIRIPMVKLSPMHKECPDPTFVIASDELHIHVQGRYHLNNKWTFRSFVDDEAHRISAVCSIGQYTAVRGTDHFHAENVPKSQRPPDIHRMVFEILCSIISGQFIGSDNGCVIIFGNDFNVGLHGRNVHEITGYNRT